MGLVHVMSSWRIHGGNHVAARLSSQGCLAAPVLQNCQGAGARVADTPVNFLRNPTAPSLPFPSPQRVHDMHANAEQFDRKTELSFKYLQVGLIGFLSICGPCQLVDNEPDWSATFGLYQPLSCRCSPLCATALPMAPTMWLTRSGELAGSC